MKKIYLMYLLCIVFLQFINAQDGKPNYFRGAPGDDVFATPSVKAFHESNLIPENLYTGKINVGIPIYDISIGDINVPISLSYNTSGIKVSDIASNVGLGWSLNANGSILKVVKDLSDDDFYGTGYAVPDDTGDNAGSYETIVTQIGNHRGKSPEPFSYYKVPTGWVHSDSEAAAEWSKIDSSPDFFYANAPGLSSKFYLEDQNPTDNTTPFANRVFNAIFLDHSGVKVQNQLQRTTSIIPRLIDVSHGNDPASFYVNGIPFYNYEYLDFPSFEVVNTNGLKYIFDTKDYSEATYRGFWNSANEGLGSTNWNLSKIIDPVHNREVIFEYEAYFKATPERIKNITATYQDPLDTDDIHDYYYTPISNVALGNGTWDMHFQNSISTRTTKAHRLKKIKWDEGTVEFIYGLNRIDDVGEKALTEILIKNNLDQLVKHFEFEYSYFNSLENCNEKECKRLRLEKVKELPISNTTVNAKEHSFDYNYDNPLPRRDSFQRDYLGYFNNNGFEWSSTDDTEVPPNAILHFYKNQGKNSVLPFKRTNGSNYRIIHGQYLLEPNAYSLTATLKTIIYPTGGSSHFKYENHTFNLQGAEYIAGGARIKQQTLHDGRGGTRKIFYEYTNSNGTSSGYINKMPTFAYINKSSDLPSNYWFHNFSMTAPENDWKRYFTYFDKTKTSLELTDGSFVGYARVIKKEIGNGYTEYNYTSANTHPNESETTVHAYNTSVSDIFLTRNSSYPSLNAIDYDIKRGKLIRERHYSENGFIKNQIDFDFDYEIFDTILLNYETTISGSPFVQGGIGGAFLHTSEINIERNLNTKVTTTNYLDNGSFTSTQEIKYDTNYPFVKEQKVLTEQGTEKSVFTYPFDSEVSNEPYVNSLVTQNRIATPVSHKSIRVLNNQSQLLSRTKYSFDLFEGIINHKSNQSAKGTNNFTTLSTIDKRDSNGNVLEYHNENGIHICLVWGYNTTKPVAKIENTSYANFTNTQNDIILAVQHTSDNDADDMSEEFLRQTLQNLRDTFPTGNMTSYTYDPLVGITSVTDARGYTMYYEYDEFNRLKTVKDADKNLLSTNEYNYKN
ncbi:RHS repeat domain-containing protein [Kordia sp.]|uniref:RHS repeat domain-containing protein n=1 Tax=Kordia sp. TaxID=1965332 RepID=UPI003D2CA929